MSNMSYCRFHNTLSDLRDCADNLHNKLSEDEAAARRRLIKVCAEILSNVGIEVDTHAEPTFYESDEDED